MDHSLDHHGRLSRSDKRPANPGRYDLRFDLRPGRESQASLWHEVIRGVEIAPGGYYNVILGRVNRLSADLFRSGQRWLSVRVVRGTSIVPETGPRVPLSGTQLQLGARLKQIEKRAGSGGIEPDERIDKLPGRVSKLKSLVEDLLERLDILEDSSGQQALQGRLDELGQRLGTLDGDLGRVHRLEDELEDLVGPHGDVVDLNERMDRIEGTAPELIDALRERERGAAPDEMTLLREGFEAIREELTRLEQRLDERDVELAAQAERPEPTAETLGAVKRAGDVMTGGLVINRGGLEVLSGGITSRGASVTTIEASNLVKAPKVIVDALELRGELTVDNPRRAIQCRLIEGRQGSARRDGALHLNTRGGGEVVIGNAGAASGVEVHGDVRAASTVVTRSALAVCFDASGDPEPGDVVRLVAGSGRAGRVAKDADPTVIGVVVPDAGLLLGGPLSSGKVAVALQGLACCKIDPASGPVQPGDLLVASAALGQARAVCADESVSPASILGKALDVVRDGMVHVLLHSG